MQVAGIVFIPDMVWDIYWKSNPFSDIELHSANLKYQNRISCDFFNAA